MHMKLGPSYQLLVLQASYTLALLTSTSYSSAVWVPSTHTETTLEELYDNFLAASIFSACLRWPFINIKHWQAPAPPPLIFTKHLIHARY